MREIDFGDGYSSAAAPSAGVTVASGLGVFASDAAFVTSKGVAAANGDAYYNSTDNEIRVYRNGAWEYISQPAVTGTRGAPQAITAAGGIPHTSKRLESLIYVAGSGGPVTLTALQQIPAGAFVGQRKRIFGTDDTNTVTLVHGNGLSLLSATLVLGNGDSADLEYDGTNWAEIERSA